MESVLREIGRKLSGTRGHERDIVPFVPPCVEPPCSLSLVIQLQSLLASTMSRLQLLRSVIACQIKTRYKHDAWLM